MNEVAVIEPPAAAVVALDPAVVGVDDEEDEDLDELHAARPTVDTTATASTPIRRRGKDMVGFPLVSWIWRGGYRHATGVTRFLILPTRSTVSIHARSTLHAIDTKTDGLEGWVEVDDGAVVGGHLELAVERLRSGNPLEDRELRRRIDARRHPTISGDVTGSGPGAQVTGTVTFMGVSRSYVNELHVLGEGDEVRIDGEATFDVREFGLQPPRILVLQVEPEVTVRIDVVAQAAGSTSSR